MKEFGLFYYRSKKMNYFTIEGFYGVNKTPCSLYICQINNGSLAYCLEGSNRIHLTWEPLEDKVWLEEVEDYDFFETSNPIWDTYDLLEELEKVGL